MSIIGLIVLLVVMGVALYLISLIPMDATSQRIIQVVVILLVVLYVLEAIGVFNGGPVLRLR